MWTCSKCGERIDDDYDICWSCGTSVEGVEDPDFFSTLEEPARDPGPGLAGTEMPGRLVTIAQCTMPAQAVAMRLRLETAGIAAFLADEFTVTMDWLLSNAIGGVKVQVAEPDVPHACELLGLDVPDEFLPDSDEDMAEETQEDGADEEFDDGEEEWDRQDTDGDEDRERSD